MKIKLTIFVALMLCFGMFLLSCGEEAQEPAEGQTPTEEVGCAEPIDEDVDGKCDKCGHAYEKYADRVDMTVKPIPSDVNEDDFFTFEVPEGVKPIDKFPPLVGGYTPGVNRNGRFVVLTYTYYVDANGNALTNMDKEENQPADGEEQEIFSRDAYYVYDFALDKCEFTNAKHLYRVDSEKYKDGEERFDRYEFDLRDYYFSARTILTSTNANGDVIEDNSWRYYTAGGEFIKEYKELTAVEEEFVGNILYLTINDDVVAIDTETGKVLRLMAEEGEKGEKVTGDKDVFVKRPEFDAVSGQYGYVFEEDFNGNVVGLQVYDLTKWIDCIYSYAIPSYVDADRSFMAVLQNGTVLTETYVPLHRNSINYDVLISGEKYDIVYTVINPIEKTTKEIEFGYDIEYIVVGAETDFATDKAINIARINPIVNDRIDSSRAMIVAIDNDLNILCQLTKVLPGQTYADREAVGKDLFIVELKVGDNYVEAVIDSDGELRAYLPESGSFEKGNGFIVAGEKIYSYDMALKYDLYNAGNELTIVNSSKDFLILCAKNANDSRKLDYYYYNSTMRAPEVIFTGDTAKEYYNYYFGEGLFVVKDTSTETPIYTIYNSENKYVASFATAPIFIEEYEGKVLIEADGTYYVFES